MCLVTKHQFCSEKRGALKSQSCFFVVICVEALALTVRCFLLMWCEALAGCKLVKGIELADKSCKFLDTKDIAATNPSTTL